MMPLPHHASLLRIWALTRKILLIAVVKHWFATIFRAILLPVAFMVFMVNIKNLIYPNNGFGIGSPAPVPSLDAVLPASRNLVFVHPPNLGSDVARVIQEITSQLQPEKAISILYNESDLLTTCRESLVGT